MRLHTLARTFKLKMELFKIVKLYIKVVTWLLAVLCMIGALIYIKIVAS
jgi:hypothetical protein